VPISNERVSGLIEIGKLKIQDNKVSAFRQSIRIKLIQLRQNATIKFAMVQQICIFRIRQCEMVTKRTIKKTAENA